MGHESDQTKNGCSPVRKENNMSQQLIDAAKAPILAYGKKDWEAIKSSVSPGFTYDEVATNRKVKGDEFIACWKDWATAVPDSQATFNSSFVSGDMVVLEVTGLTAYLGDHEPAGQSL